MSETQQCCFLTDSTTTADKNIHTMVPFIQQRDLIKDAHMVTGPGVSHSH